MAKSNMDQDILKVLLSEEEIKARVQELGDRLYDRFKDKNPMFVGVLNGCFIFMADLVRAAQLKSEVEFIGLSSYKNATKSSGVVQITRDLQRDISGRDIIIVEDILDSGNTLYFLTEYLKTKGAASVTIATLLDKPARREKPISADYAGFEVPDEFVVGYGLDYCQQYRNMPYIGVLKPEVYSKVKPRLFRQYFVTAPRRTHGTPSSPRLVLAKNPVSPCAAGGRRARAGRARNIPLSI